MHGRAARSPGRAAVTRGLGAGLLLFGFWLLAMLALF